MWKAVLNFFTGGIVGRLFDTTDRKVAAESDKERLKADVLQTWLRNRVAMPWFVDFAFIGPLAFWWGAVCVYSVFFHAGGPFPQTWDIAALPHPLDQWAGWIIGARFAPALITQFLKR